MRSARGFARHRIRILLGAAVLLTFVLSSAGLLELRIAVDTDFSVHRRLAQQLLAEGRLPAVFGSRDFLVFITVGVLLAVALPALSPLGACALTVAAAALPFWLAWQFPVRPEYVPLELSLLMILVLFVVNVLAGWFSEVRAKRSIVGVFGQYVPPQVVQTLSEQPERLVLEGEARELSVFFSDIKNFSGISEHLDPRELARMLNTYFTLMTDILYRHEATIDKYIGDAIMAFWGAPLPQPDHAARALAAAVDMQRKMVEVRREFTARGWPEIHVGIGINTGIMNVGNMGSRFRIAYTVVGDAVNLGARIEQLTRGYDVEIIVSETTRAVIGGYLFRELDYVRVKGKHLPTRLFEPVCREEDADAGMRADLDLHRRGIEAYYRRDWASARELFARMKAGGRFNSRYYDTMLARIAKLEHDPPPADWDGVTNLGPY